MLVSDSIVVQTTLSIVTNTGCNAGIGTSLVSMGNGNFSHDEPLSTKAKYRYHFSDAINAAWPAANRAMGTRGGEQET